MENLLKSVAQKTSADDKSIGFDYQYYYFLDRLLNLKSGQSAGLEVDDDVHVEINADFVLLFQLKHTVQKAASGKAIALPELDVDLWKTISNWSNIICDEAYGRKGIAAQLDFVRKTEFHLITNKSQSKSNNFLETVRKMQALEVDFLEVLKVVAFLESKTTDATIKSYIRTLLTLAPTVTEQFLRRLFVELELDDVIERVKSSVRDKFIDPVRVDEVFARLDSTIRQDNFLAIKAGEPILISYHQFMTRYRTIFVDGRSETLPFPQFVPVLPGEIFSQIFVKRLIEIEALDPGDVESAVDLTLQKLRLARYLEAWVQSGDLTSLEVNEFHTEVLLRWKNVFQFAFRKLATAEEIVDVALQLLVRLREEKFRVGPSELDTQLSNGELYYLSDDGKIGWHRDWESL